MTREDIQPVDLAVAVAKGLLEIGKVVGALAVVGMFGWKMLSPFILDYVEEQRAQMTDEILRAIGHLPRPVVEVTDGGWIVDEGPFAPGDVVRIMYLLRRNEDCPTSVEVQFRGETGAVLSEYSSTIHATRAPVTVHPSPFVARVKIPKNLPSGRYSYSPTLIPAISACASLAPIPVVPSQYFTVVARRPDIKEAD